MGGKRPFGGGGQFVGKRPFTTHKEIMYMAQMPIEIAEIGLQGLVELQQAIGIANHLQEEFIYINLANTGKNAFSALAYRSAKVSELMDSLEAMRKELKGYHPFTVAFVNSELRGEKLSNLFGSYRAKQGVAVVTIHNVEGPIVPEGRMTAYFLYYLARCSLKFVVPNHKNHQDTRECLYDQMIYKKDILKSMKANSICDECRQVMLSSSGGVSSNQLQAIDLLLKRAAELLQRDVIDEIDKPTLPGRNKREAITNDRSHAMLHYFAEKDTRQFFWGYSSAIFILYLVLIWLVLSFGWNVMEPFTYFIGGAALIGSYFYFGITQREWTPAGIYQSYLDRRLQHYLTQFDLDAVEIPSVLGNG